MPHPIPKGHHTITPHLIIKGASEAIEFYKKAFGAEEVYRMPFPSPDGKMKLGHAEIKIGDSFVFLADEFPQQGGLGPQGNSPVTIHLYVTDADAAFNRAVAAGATVKMPLANMFWGDRYGQLQDPFGHVWSIATHQRDVTPEQMQADMKKMMSPTCAGEQQ